MCIGMQILIWIGMGNEIGTDIGLGLEIRIGIGTGMCSGSGMAIGVRIRLGIGIEMNYEFFPANYIVL